jgi:hypothetical protein
MTTPLAVAPDPLVAYPPVLRWVLTRQPVSAALLPLLAPPCPLEALYARCAEQAAWPEALRLVGAVLPVRESVWWAWVSVRYALQPEGGPAPTPEVHAAITAIEQWIVRPDDDHRRAAWGAGQAAGLDTPAGMVGAAVFLSGPSVAPTTVAPVPPPPGSTLPLITGAILLSAAAAPDPAQLPATLQAFATQGLEIVKRLGGWDTAAQLAYDTHHRLLEEYQRATGGTSSAGAPR